MLRRTKRTIRKIIVHNKRNIMRRVGMVLNDEGSGHYITHHIGIGKTDWLEIYDGSDMVSLKFTSENLAEEDYYHLEIGKKSELWKNIVSAIKEADAR